MSKRGPTREECLQQVRDLEQRLFEAQATIADLRSRLDIRASSEVTASDSDQLLIEELQTANEELQSQAAELEVQAEELQVQAEELETQNEELQRVSGELETERALLHTVLDQMPLGVIVAEAPSGRFLLANRQMAAVIGRAVPMAKNLREYDHYRGLHPDGRPFSPKDYPLAQCLASGTKTLEEEINFIRADGSPGVIRVSATPVRNARGELIAGVGTYQDITARKQAEVALRQSNKRTADILESISDGFFSIDRDMVVTYVNNAALALWGGRQRDEVLGRRLLDAFPEAEGSIFVEKYAEALREKKFISLEAFFEADPYRNWYDVRIFPYEDGISIYFQVTTERKKQEAAIIRAKQDWERTFDAVPDLITIMDADHRMVRVNRATAQALGKEPQELIGRHCYEFMHESRSIPSVCPHQQLLADGREHTAELRELNRDFLVTTSPILNDDGSLFGSVHIARDITACKQAEEALQKFNAELEQALKETEQRQRETEALLHASRAVMEHRTFEDAAWEIFQDCKAMTMAFAGYIALLSPDGAENEVLFLDAGGLPCTVDPDLPMPIRGFREEAYRTGQVVFDNDFAASRHAAFLPPGHVTLENVLFAPMVHEGKVVGLIGLANKPGGFTAHDARLAAGFADLAAIALVSRRAEEKLQQAHAELEQRVQERTFELRQTVEQLQNEVTERQEAEKQAENLGRLYRVMSRVNETIVRVPDREPLFQETCRIAVEDGGLRMAWVGLTDPDGKVVKVAAKYGHDQGYLDNLLISLKDVPESRGPTGVAVREGRYDICNDFADEPRMAPWREKALARGYLSSGAFPLRVGGEVVGAITLYAGTPWFFNQEEIALLEALADDLSFALESMDREVKRRQAEEEVKKLNEELEKRVKERTAQLEAANREMEAFSYSVSHDLKAPIRAIDGFSKMLMAEHTAQLDPEALRLLQVVRHNTGYMAQLIEDLLALSRLGRREIRKTRLDLAAMCVAAFKEIKDEDPGRRVELTVQDLPPACGDSSLMRQVLVNLLTNAFKFTKPRKDAAIEVGGWCADGENVYYVKDNGVGFDMRYQEKLFGVFQRLHKQGEFEGTGVGLAIVQRILQRHGGRTWAEGKLGEGATFYFALPNRGK